MTSDAERAEVLRERVRRLLPQVLADSARAELRLQAAERLLPRVLADAATAGFRPRVDLDLSEGGDVEMSVWYAPGSPGRWDGRQPADRPRRRCRGPGVDRRRGPGGDDGG